MSSTPDAVRWEDLQALVDENRRLREAREACQQENSRLKGELDAARRRANPSIDMLIAQLRREWDHIESATQVLDALAERLQP